MPDLDKHLSRSRQLSQKVAHAKRTAPGKSVG